QLFERQAHGFIHRDRLNLNTIFPAAVHHAALLALPLLAGGCVTSSRLQVDRLQVVADQRPR
ncbi:MAG: hypothetical protein ACTHMU_03260, partial [Thermomicrobiales bacterium]